MNLHILWTPIALQSLSEVFVYTYTEFGERQLRKLTSQIYSATRRISAFPHSGKLETAISEATGVEYRSMVVISEILLLYTVMDDTIYIEYVKNTRQDDSTILKKLSEE